MEEETKLREDNDGRYGADSIKVLEEKNAGII